jgi:hypothetical protein
MARLPRLSRSASIGLAALAISARGLAEEVASEPPERELLDALIKQSDRVARSSAHDVTHNALAFLDARIAELTNRQLLNALLERRAKLAHSNDQEAIALLDRQILELRTRHEE